jgi:hypothetical protein
MQVSLFRNGIIQTSEPENFEVLQILQSIKNPSTDVIKNKVEELRKLENKKEKSAFKKSFPYATFSGVFSKRDASSLVKHSGLICLDFDDVENLDDTFIQLKSEAYIFSMFVSPSGTGLKVLIKIRPEKHLDNFLELEKYFFEHYKLKADKSGKDVCRACFLTHDPNLYLNENSLLFDVENFYKVDTDTGEIVEVKQQSFHFAENEKKEYNVLEHALMIVERIEASKRDITLSYEDWLLTAFSLASLGEEGRSIFHRVSAMYPEYKYEEADKKFTNAISTTRFTSAGKFFTLCRDNGIDISYYEKKEKKTTNTKKTQAQAPPDHNKPKKEMTLDERKALVKNLKTELGKLIPETKEYFAKEKELKEAEKLLPSDKKKKKSLGEDYKEGEDYKRNKEELSRRLPKGVNVDDFLALQFYEHNGKYYFQESGNYFKEQTNFIMKVKYLIRSDIEPKRLVEFKNCYGDKEIIAMNSESLISVNKFKAIIEGKGYFMFDGNERHLQKIKNKIYRDNPRCEEVNFLGYQPKLSIYAFANGIFDGKRFHEVDEYGIVEHEGKHIYIPALSKITEDDNSTYENERKFVYIKSSIKFHEWADVFYKMYGIKSIIAIGFYLSSIFRDIIFSQVRFFPLLNLFGAPGSGKNTMAESLMFMFGHSQQAFALGGAGTPKGFMRKFGQFYNALVWLDEYKNSIDLKKIESIKNIYDGLGYETAKMTRDSKTQTSPVYSACILSGEELPTGNEALFKRVILVEFESTTFTDEENRNKEILIKHQLKGLSSITTEVLKHRDLIHQNFYEKFLDYKRYLAKSVTEKLDERILSNYSMLIAVLDILAPHIKLPFSIDDAKKYFSSRIVYQSTLISGNSKVSKFWDIVEFLYKDGRIVADQDFKIIDNILHISLSKVHPLYLVAHAQQHGEKGLDKSSLTSYLEKTNSYEGYSKSVRFGNSVNPAYRFDIDKLPIRLNYIAPEREEHTEVYQPIDNTPVPFQQDIFKENSKENLPF